MPTGPGEPAPTPPGREQPLAGAPETLPPAGLSPPPRRKCSPDSPRPGNMAQEAGDMEDGQLSDSDSDMMVAPSDRPLQVPVSVEG